MGNTVNTNVGALTALSSLRTNTNSLNFTSKRVETGFRVNDAHDDAAVFAVAQSVRGNVKAYAQVQSSLANGIGLGEVTLSAINGIDNLTGDIKAKIIALSDGSLTATQQDVYRGDIHQMIRSINNYIGQASYNGKNILTGDARATPISFVADVSGTTLTYSTVHQLDWDSDEALGPNVLFPTPNDVTDTINANPPNTTQALASLRAFEGRVQETREFVVSQKRAMEQQQDFINNLVDAFKKSVGVLVDADVGNESAELQSRQVMQQLSLQALSIANQQPNILLGLLR